MVLYKYIGNKKNFKMDTNKIKIISKEKVFELLENKEDFKLVEVLSEENYTFGHLPDAINIPADKIDDLSTEMLPDKNQLIVVYCSGFLCSASTNVTKKLQSMGYANVLDYKGGKDDWSKTGLPLVSEK